MLLKKIKCGICGKEFSSKKALYGHMRSHPERPWRGMQPPTTTQPYSSSAGSSSSASGGVDESPIIDSSSSSKSLPCWSLTARRGRKSIASGAAPAAAAPASSAVVSAETKNSIDYKFLCDANSYYVGSSSKRNLHIETKKRKMDVLCNAVDHMGSVKRKVHVDDEEKEKEKEVALRKEYKCKICSKTFSSPQALGGHKSSHYKLSKTETEEAEAPISDQDGIGERRMLDFDLNELPPLDDIGEPIQPSSPL